MSERIAAAVDDLRRGRVARPESVEQALVPTNEWEIGTVVDVTKIYHSVLNGGRIHLYQAFPCVAPPWEVAVICFETPTHHEVCSMVAWFQDGDEAIWNTADDCDWDRVKWRLNVLVFMTGQPKGQRTTLGPLFAWRIAIYEDGSLGDVGWLHLDESIPMETWDTPLCVFLASYNFMNCRNVDLVEPRRSRAEARRIARYGGVKISEINVFPLGRSSGGGKGTGAGVPLTSVIGHMAHYGPQYGRGLLFGKYAGRFWIPQHARGSAEFGEVHHNYKLHPEEEG